MSGRKVNIDREMGSVSWSLTIEGLAGGQSEDEALIHYVFDEKLDGSEIVAEFEWNQLSRCFLLSMRPKAWVDGEVICMVVEMLTHDERVLCGESAKRWFLPTRFAQAALCKEMDIVEYGSRSKWKERYMSFMDLLEKIFVPMLDEVRRHWFLLLVQVDLKEAEIWDPKPDLVGMVRRERISRCLVRLFNSYFIYDFAMVRRFEAYIGNA